MSTRKLSLIVALGGVAAMAASAYQRERQRRVQYRAQTQPEHLQTWEGEGGGVPTGGPGASRIAGAVRPTPTSSARVNEPASAVGSPSLSERANAA